MGSVKFDSRSLISGKPNFPDNVSDTFLPDNVKLRTFFSQPLYSAKEIYSGVPDKLSGPDYFPLPSQTSPRRIPKTTPDLPIQTSSRTPSELFPRPELKTMVHLFNTCSEVYIICHETKFQGEGHRHLTRTKVLRTFNANP